ncbi:MAG: major capsid protein [Clostridiales bacterium]|nr:major capsid protein [Clostridiales bacterium]
MAYDIYSPEYMLAAIKEMRPEYTFIRDRYFAHDTSTFKTEKVFVDYDDGAGRILAPYVLPAVGPVPLTRDGYETRELIPPYISVSMPLTITNLVTRLAGESIVSTMTPEQRERHYLISDMDTLDHAITRREEWMCVNTMLDNACTMHHIGNNGDDTGKDLIAQYYDDENPGVFTVDEPWDVGKDEYTPGTWYTGTCDVLSDMRKAGRDATEMVVGSEVAQMILTDPWAWKMLDNRRAQLGEIDPRWQSAGVTRLGNLNFGGKNLDIFCYEGTYEERDVKTRKLTSVDYFPSTAAMLAAPGTGKLLYGAVNQMERDEMFHTRTGTRVPKYTADVKHNTKETMLTSRPIAAPIYKSPWRACRDVLNATTTG